MVREWRADEVEAMHRWLGDPEVMRHLSFGTTSLAETRAHLDLVVQEQRRLARERYWLAVELRESAQVVGDVGLTLEVGDDGAAVGAFGWFFERARWGQGLASEAVRLLVDFGFEQLGLDRERASCDARNTSSERIMQRCGMRFDRDVPRRSQPGRRRHYQLERSTWLERASFRA